MKSISQLRAEVDATDKKILQLLGKRMELVQSISKQKQKEGVPVLDREREKQVNEEWRERASELGLRTEPVSKILKEVLAMSKKAQSEVTR